MTDRISGLLSRIPGYDGYRDKENRRDEDRRLREAIAESLTGIVDRITSVNTALANARQLTSISRMEALISGTRMLADRVQSASYGYGGIFTEQSIDELALEQLRQFDLAFQKHIATLYALASRFSTGKAPLEADLTDYASQLAMLNSVFDARSSVIDTARPNRDANVLALLDPVDPPAPSPLSGLKVNDTLAILGDNYQVDATVTITDGETIITLARINASANTWLTGASDDSLASAKVTEQVGAQPAIGSVLQPARISVVTGANASGPVAGGYSIMKNAGATIGLAFQIGDAYRQFEGNIVDHLDVEVFGTATKQGEN